MRSKSHNGRAGDTGFTLLEALVALAILAASLGAIGALGATSIRSGLSFERHFAQIETMRRILTGLARRGDASNGALAGVSDGYKWQIDARPYAPPLVGAKATNLWEPQIVTARVFSPEGSWIEIDTIRLRARAQQ